MTRILIVDDHALVRGTMSERLNREPDLQVVGDAATADRAIEQARELSPNVVLMDIDMPGLICFDAVRTMQNNDPSLRVLFVSAFLQDWYVEQVVALDSAGYLLKSEPAEVAVAAIREVAAGGRYFSPEVHVRMAALAQRTPSKAASPAGLAALTARETEVLRYIARGMSKKEIAGIMHLSVKTVDRHCANLMKKLDIHDRVELARFAIREGLSEA